MTDIVSATKAEFSKVADAQVAEVQSKISALVDDIAKNAPAGSEKRDGNAEIVRRERTCRLRANEQRRKTSRRSDGRPCHRSLGPVDASRQKKQRRNKKTNCQYLNGPRLRPVFLLYGRTPTFLNIETSRQERARSERALSARQVTVQVRQLTGNAPQRFAGSRIYRGCGARAP
ncbi:hypothetical protein ACFS07_17545 [Undibacterium arcticum]